MVNVFMISDLHFDHEAIIYYENRPFKTVEEMNEVLIDNWNKTVKERDQIFIMGDLGFFNEERAREIINRLNGQKKLILGNHDDSIAFWKKVGEIDEIYQYPIIYKKFWMLSHEPLYVNKNMPYCNIHGHIHSLKYKTAPHSPTS